MAKAPQEHNEISSTSDIEKPVCGVIRPIAELGDYPASHWVEVHAIIADAVEKAGYRARLVSDSDAAGVILSEIVTNLYNDPIVICDVSGRNANVMFELGMRLAFEKPVIIIKDDKTPFSFDTSPVKHLLYPQSLRFQSIIDFKKDLTRGIVATIEASKKSDYRGYLQQFGPIAVTQLGEQSITLDAFAEELRDTRRMLRSLQPSQPSMADIYPRSFELFLKENSLEIQIIYDPTIISWDNLKLKIDNVLKNFSISRKKITKTQEGSVDITLIYIGNSKDLPTFVGYMRQLFGDIDGVLEFIWDAKGI